MPDTRFWNFAKNEGTEEVELRISGDIVEDEMAWIYELFGDPCASPNAFRTELAMYAGKDITVWIDSYGGGVFAGAGIYNALKEHKGKVTVKVDGKAMSMASVIAMAGDEIQMSPVAVMMIHNPSTFAWGEAKDMRHAADILDEVKETIINAYAMKSGRSRSKISEMMNEETYLGAKKAIKEGFADKMLYADAAGQSTESLENSLMFSRMAIQNSMADSMKKFMEVARLKNVPEPGSQQPPATPAAATINSNKEERPVEIKTQEELRAAYPDLVSQIEAAAKQEGAAAECNRIKDIEAIAANIDPKLVADAKYVNPVDAKTLAFNAMTADGAKGAKYLENAVADGKGSGADKVPPAQPGDPAPAARGINDVVASVTAKIDAQRRGVKQ